jgi:hypothetical protein
VEKFRKPCEKSASSFPLCYQSHFSQEDGLIGEGFMGKGRMTNLTETMKGLNY